MLGACGHLPRCASGSCSSSVNSTSRFEHQPVIHSPRRKLSTASRVSDELPASPFSNRLAVDNLAEQPQAHLSTTQTLQENPPRFTKSHNLNADSISNDLGQHGSDLSA